VLLLLLSSSSSSSSCAYGNTLMCFLCEGVGCGHERLSCGVVYIIPLVWVQVADMRISYTKGGLEEADMQQFVADPMAAWAAWFKDASQPGVSGLEHGYGGRGRKAGPYIHRSEPHRSRGAWKHDVESASLRQRSSHRDAC
jgi:hypothetical protein